MSKGKFRFNGVQKQKGRPTIVNGIEGQRYVVNKYLENLMNKPASRSDDYRVYTSTEYQDYDAFADETLGAEQQQSDDPGANVQQDWSGQQDAPYPQDQPELSEEQKWSQEGYEQQMSGQQPAMQDSWGQQGYVDQQMSEQPPTGQDAPSGQPQAYEQQMTDQQPAAQDLPWGQQGYAEQQMSEQQPAVQDSPWGQPQAYEQHMSGQQPAALQNQPWGQPRVDNQQLSDQHSAMKDSPWGQPQADPETEALAQPQSQPFPQSQSQPQDQVQSREQQSTSHSMLRNLFSDSQPQIQPAESMAPPQPTAYVDQQQSGQQFKQESQVWQGEQQKIPPQRNSQEIQWSGKQPQQQPVHQQPMQQQPMQLQPMQQQPVHQQPMQQQPMQQQPLQQPLQQQPMQQQQQPQQPPQQQQRILQPPQQQFGQSSKHSGRQKTVDPQEQQQWHRVDQPQPPQPVEQAEAPIEPPRREHAPKTMMFEKPRPRTGEMARIRRTQDGFEVTKTQQAMRKLDDQFFAAQEALNTTFAMPNTKGAKRQQEKKNMNVVKSVRGTVEFLVHANGRTFTPTYNKVGVLTAVEVSDGFVLTRGERGDSSWTMTDKEGNSVEEDPITGVAFDKKGNLWYETQDGRRTTFNIDGTTKTAMKD